MNYEVSMGVLTSYMVGDKIFSAYVTGSEFSEIRNKIAIRGLNENIESSIMEIDLIPDYQNSSLEEFLVDLPNVIHSACFMASIALRSNTLTIDEVLGDEGILHELIHINSKSIPISDQTIEKIKQGFIKLRAVTSGVC